MVGEAVGKVLAAMTSAVDDLPNVTGKDDVCKESLGRLLGACCGTRASISLDGSGCSDVRLFVSLLTLCVESAGATGFIARASMSERNVLVGREQIRTGWNLWGREPRRRMYRRDWGEGAG